MQLKFCLVLHTTDVRSKPPDTKLSNKSSFYTPIGPISLPLPAITSRAFVFQKLLLSAAVSKIMPATKLLSTLKRRMIWQLVGVFASPQMCVWVCVGATVLKLSLLMADIHQAIQSPSYESPGKVQRSQSYCSLRELLLSVSGVFAAGLTRYHLCTRLHP